MQFNCPLVLASSSPRRKHLLSRLGATFTIDAADVDESFDPSDHPADIVQALAQKKGDVVAGRHPEALVLAADTLVVLEGDILGKPANEEDAIAMLQRLSNRSHHVFTGLALLHPASDRAVTAFEKTQVHFAPMTVSEIEGYVATGSPLDKAGSYGIQDDRGALFIPKIEGDFYNVVGLPLRRLYTTLKNSFSDLLIL